MNASLSQNLLASHDIVAQRDYLPKLKDVPLEVDEDEETVKLVQLVKSQEPLVSETARSLILMSWPTNWCMLCV